MPFLKGRDEDTAESKQRTKDTKLKYPVLVVANDKGKVFAILDGTHRVEKAHQQGLKKIKVRILPKKALKSFQTP